MPLTLGPDGSMTWSVRKIAVVGPGIVGTPMAAMLAHAQVRIGNTEPARVLVVQRRSPTSSWKVEAINQGRSPIGGIEPDLDRLLADSVTAGLLSATHNPDDVADADVVLVCVQTDKHGYGPDYGPLLDALHGVAAALLDRPAGQLPLIIIESTLAPSSMGTIVRDLFARYGLVDGRDILLGNSPNRVMPGRLVARVSQSDKLAAGLDPRTAGLIARLYRHVVTQGAVHETTSLTAEIVKTLENAYRDVRIAYAAELCRWCDDHDVDFFALRDAVNARVEQPDAASHDPAAVPSGGVLVPTIGVGGHCLPKDGVLLWWRRRQHGQDPRRSLILQARRVNEASPAATVAQLERLFGDLGGRRLALLGTAYRADSEDTRNSPTLALAQLLLARGATVRLHDPHVNPGDQNLVRQGFAASFSRDLATVTSEAEVLVICAAHRAYTENLDAIVASAPRLTGVFDGCHVTGGRHRAWAGITAGGFGWGTQAPSTALVAFAAKGFQAVERGLANEVRSIIRFMNTRYVSDPAESASFEEVQRLAATCVTGCAIADPGPVFMPSPFDGFLPSLVRIAGKTGGRGRATGARASAPGHPRERPQFPPPETAAG